MDISKGIFCCTVFCAFVVITSMQSANAAIYKCQVYGQLVLQQFEAKGNFGLEIEIDGSKKVENLLVAEQYVTLVDDFVRFKFFMKRVPQCGTKVS
ncbi:MULTISPECIES: hypothetical protein [Shewanella]|uniref:hypothetical protein n=1 Tax=Shewanella TaxID=22 RepID=UPI0006647C5A|nr:MULTISPECIES: hypothetical protein [Shewanella]MCU8004204.1 hypothetical protein [Shewanella sp. SM96]